MMGVDLLLIYFIKEVKRKAEKGHQEWIDFIKTKAFEECCEGIGIQAFRVRKILRRKGIKC